MQQIDLSNSILRLRGLLKIAPVSNRQSKVGMLIPLFETIRAASERGHSHEAIAAALSTDKIEFNADHVRRVYKKKGYKKRGATAADKAPDKRTPTDLPILTSPKAVVDPKPPVAPEPEVESPPPLAPHLAASDFQAGPQLSPMCTLPPNLQAAIDKLKPEQQNVSAAK